ncbi:MAG: hypothetical protein WC822_04345 [Candidatus Paceibacterota bacterium]|jgi:hypothetical protein
MKNKTIKEWQKIITENANKKFPDNFRWTEQDRFISIVNQLSDVGTAIQVEQGLRKKKDENHNDLYNPDHRIAALIADIFILTEMRGTDLEKELRKVLKWFKD